MKDSFCGPFTSKSAEADFYYGVALELRKLRYAGIKTLFENMDYEATDGVTIADMYNYIQKDPEYGAIINQVLSLQAYNLDDLYRKILIVCAETGTISAETAKVLSIMKAELRTSFASVHGEFGRKVAPTVADTTLNSKLEEFLNRANNNV